MNLCADLRPLLGPARNQGQRPTCLSFAVSDAHRGARRHADVLSPECLHARAARLLRQVPDLAITLQAAGQALHLVGQVAEGAWPYGGSGPTPATAASYRAQQALQAFEPGKVEADLSAGRPVVVVLGIGDEFYNGVPITTPLRRIHPPVEANHAVVIVGFAAAAGGSLFLLRNSWGLNWGEEGHTWAHVDYLALASIGCMTYEGVN